MTRVTKNSTFALTDMDKKKLDDVRANIGATSRSEAMRRIIDRVWREGI